jgi:hypothetical protein
LSLHIFAQSLAEKKHALKISSDHTLIIMCNQAVIDIPREFGCPRPNLTWGPSWFHLLKLWLRGSGGENPWENVETPKSQKWPNPAFGFLEVCCQLYLCIFYCNSLFGPPPFNWGPRKNCPLHPLTAPTVTTIYDSIVS